MSGTVAAIGRRLHTLAAQHKAANEASLGELPGSPAQRAAVGRMIRVFPEIRALQTEAAAVPAQTLADAAAQLLLCVRWVDALHALDGGEDSAQVRRMLAGVALAVAANGRLDLARLGDKDTAALCASVPAESWPPGS